MLQHWLDQNNLPYTWLVDQKVFQIDQDKFCVIKEKEDRILDDTFDLILDEEEGELIQEHDCKYLVFQLGEWIFYTLPDKIKLTPLKYLGQSKQAENFPYIGIHGMYEICNGSKNYKEWCKKAKFLGIKTLGICEYNTLAGTLQFQLDCLANEIKPILGITALVKDEKNYTYRIKVYARNEIGWRNILYINKAINVDNEGFIKEYDWLELTQETIVIFENILTDWLIDEMSIRDVKYYFKLDPVQWKSDDRDKKHLEYIKWVYENVPDKAILVCDSYYLDKQDSRTKTLLNKIGKINIDNQSDDQYFKSKEEIEQQLIPLFNDENKGKQFVQQAFENLSVFDEVDFKINTKEFHLPQYQLSKIEDLLFASKYDLFWDLMDRGLEEKVIKKGKNPEPYYERLQMEFEIIDKGGFVDYFLMLADVVKYCEENNILVGAGRGSAAGSIISYFLNITKVDPIEYGLIFERFLNPARITKGLPDVDLDFESVHRLKVVEYLKERYGIDNVCAIGSYGQLKVKSSLHELCRMNSIFPQTANFYAAMMDKAGDEYDYLFETALSNPKFKEFVQDNYDMFNDLLLVLNNFKNTSIHASGIIVTPKKYGEKEMTIYDWIPVKKVDGELISQWDGVQLDKCGFLKADILGLKELDKFSEILSLIEKNGKGKPKIYDLIPNDENVYELFKQGLTQDVFQFGTDGLIQYCSDAKPSSLDDLAIINAIYRPGAMSSNAHNDYLKIKLGRKEIQYDYGLKEVTENTYGLYIFQETVMMACQVLGGMSLSEADTVRKGMGKKQYDEIIKYKDKFIESAINKGCEKEEAERIWNKLEVFSGYGFNKSHAITYSYMGYIGQYLKYHFPIEFWTVSLQNAKDEDVPKRISEINRSQSIKILSPDINKSGERFTSDFKTNSIYWSIGKIRNVGEVALKAIMEEREKNGNFFSLEEFISRVDKRKVNRTAIINLILSGCFDEIENIKYITDRYKLLVKFAQLRKEKIGDEFEENTIKKDWFWFLKQRAVSGSGLYDYEKLLPSLKHIQDAERYYTTFDKIGLQDNLDCEVLCIGILVELTERKSKKGMFAHLVLDQNNSLCEVNVWNESWEIYKEMLLQSENKIVSLTGKIVFDPWKKKQIVHTNSLTKIEAIG